MLADLWPSYRLRITTPRLSLRLPAEDELAGLARLAGRGVHPATERPFLTPWTDGSATDRERFVLRQHWEQLSSWSVSDWWLGLGVFSTRGEPLGMLTLRARGFEVLREVTASSWLGLAHQRQGVGTEARVGVLTLAFGGLRAEAALTEVFQDNTASQRVLRRLGYEQDGISRDVRGTEVVVSDRLRLRRAVWQGQDHPGVEVEGVDDCASMFGSA